MIGFMVVVDVTTSTATMARIISMEAKG